MANHDWNFDGLIDASDDYTIDILCAYFPYLENSSVNDYADLCTDYTVTTPKFLSMVDANKLDRVTSYFPLGIPPTAIDEGDGLGYFIVNNQCVSAWGTECLPQQQTHFIATYAPSEEYIPPVSAWYVFGVVLAFVVGYLFIRAFAMRGGHV